MPLRDRIRQGLSQWADQAHAEAQDLKREMVRSGTCSIADAPDRELVTVQGSLRTLTLRPRGGVPALEAELYDGTGSITILWLGRRRIAGIFPGRSIRVTGRIGVQHGERVMFNPRYDLKA